MDVNEFMEWVAYYRVCDPDEREKIKRKVAQEYSQEESAIAIKQMFMRLASGISK